jgi:hypothetical protein
MKSNNTPMGIRPEDDLLLCCSRTELDSERAEKIRVLLQKEINWSYLIETALRHGLMPLLYRNLKSICPDAVPEAVLDQLRQYFLANAARNFFLTEELLNLLHLFEGHGIPAIPYKGPALAASIYGDLTLRQVSDLDILIRKEDMLEARDLLVPLGYRPQFQLTHAQAAAYQRSQYEFLLIRNKGRLTVELKWEIVDRFFSFPMDYECLWGRLKPISLDGKEVLTFSPEDLLLILCVHGAKHLWTNLIWVCDVAELVHLYRGLDWEWVMKQASTVGGQRMLFLGLFLARSLLDAPLPEEIRKQVEAEPMVKRLAKQVEQRLCQESDGLTGLWETSLFHLKARERLKDRICYCSRLAMSTTPGDWTFQSLPDSLLPLYYLIRPIRLAAKYGLKPLWARLREGPPFRAGQ